MLNLLPFRQRRISEVRQTDVGNQVWLTVHVPVHPDSVEWFCRLINFFHTKLGKLFLYGFCSQRHCRPANMTSKYAGMFCHCKVCKKNCLLMWLLMPWPCYTTFCLVIRNLAVSHTQDKTRERRSPSSHVALLLMFGENQVTKRKCRKSGCIRKCLLVLGVQQGIVLTNTEQLLCL